MNLDVVDFFYLALKVKFAKVAVSVKASSKATKDNSSCCGLQSLAAIALLLVFLKGNFCLMNDFFPGEVDVMALSVPGAHGKPRTRTFKFGQEPNIIILIEIVKALTI